jgi:hypothetical protein
MKDLAAYLRDATLALIGISLLLWALLALNGCLSTSLDANRRAFNIRMTMETNRYLWVVNRIEDAQLSGQTHTDVPSSFLTINGARALTQRHYFVDCDTDVCTISWDEQYSEGELR